MASQTANISKSKVDTGNSNSTPNFSYVDGTDTYPAVAGSLSSAYDDVPATVTWDEAQGETLKGEFTKAIQEAFNPYNLRVLVNRSETVGTTWDPDAGSGFYAHPLDLSGSSAVVQAGGNGNWEALSIHVQ